MRDRWFLLAAVFFGGICSLGVELSASRLLAPFFGTSQLIWANVIGLCLIYLTIGYTLGGRLADRRPDERLLGLILIGSGLSTAIIPLIARPILQWSASAFSSFSVGIFFGSLFGVLILFSVPIILVGMVSPFAIRLSVRDVNSAGSTAGSLYALSTLGSIIGTFLPVLVLIPTLGTSRTFYVMALMLVIVGALGLRRRAGYLAIPAVLILAAFQLGISGIRAPFCTGCVSLFETESSYNYIQVAANQFGPDRTEQIGLILNEGQAIHSIYNTRFGETQNPDDLLTAGPWDFFNVAPYLYADRTKADVDGLMMIGSAAGTVPKQFLTFYGQEARIDAVEIDPEIIRIGREYFAVEDLQAPNYRTIAADGRTYLRDAEGVYDVIGMDAYHQPYIPFHLTTQEFFSEVNAHLSDHGVAVVNAGKPGSDYRLVHALASTMRSVFPQVYIMDVPTFGNSIIFGVKQPVGDGVANFEANLSRMDDPTLARVMQWALDSNENKLPLREWTEQDASAMRPFTDDWAPVESVIDQLIVNAAERGISQ